MNLSLMKRAQLGIEDTTRRILDPLQQMFLREFDAGRQWQEWKDKLKLLTSDDEAGEFEEDSQDNDDDDNDDDDDKNDNASKKRKKNKNTKK